MFISETHLPQLLSPDKYCSENQYRLELDRLFVPGWHCVGSTADTPLPGDFITLDLFGHPLMVRNADGVVRTFLNVCSHRHCTLTDERCGRQEVLRCQYHGWEYDHNGHTRKIPDSKSFRPFSDGRLGLKEFRTQTCGQLVFVSLNDNGNSLKEHLGHTYDKCLEWFAPEHWRQVLKFEIECPANWKIPVENSLESYHVSCVHKDSLGAYPAEEYCTHEMTEQFTAFHTNDRHQRSLMHKVLGLLVRLTGRSPTFSYTHRQTYPNFFNSVTDFHAIMQSIIPTSATSHRSVWRFFARRGKPGSVIAKILLPIWCSRGTKLWAKVVREDLGVLAAMQRGLGAATQPSGGLISTREERVFHFQQYIHRMCGTGDESSKLGRLEGLSIPESKKS